MDEPWKSPHRPVSDPLTPEQRKLTNALESVDERDAWMLENAEHFVVGRRLGPREGYERHTTKTLAEAIDLAQTKANEVRRPYLIYAVSGPHDALVRVIKPVGF